MKTFLVNIMPVVRTTSNQSICVKIVRAKDRLQAIDDVCDQNDLDPTDRTMIIWCFEFNEKEMITKIADVIEHDDELIVLNEFVGFVSNHLLS